MINGTDKAPVVTPPESKATPINSSGTKINVLTPFNSTIGDMLDNYAIKMGLGKDVVDTGIYFLFSGAKLRKNDRMNIIEKGITNGSIIMVIDRNAVLGA